MSSEPIRFDFPAKSHPWNPRAASRRVRGRFTCCYCGHKQDRRAPNQRVCDRRICRKRQKAAHNAASQQSRVSQYAGSAKRPTRSKDGRYGARVSLPLPPPLCHGRALSFGSDPMTGRSLQWCAVCGEQPVPIQGTREYDQRPVLQQELEAAVNRACAHVDGAYRKRGKMQPMTVGTAA